MSTYRLELFANEPEQFLFLTQGGSLDAAHRLLIGLQRLARGPRLPSDGGLAH